MNSAISTGVCTNTGWAALVAEYPVMFRAWSMTGSLIIAMIAIYWVIERTLL